MEKTRHVLVLVLAAICCTRAELSLEDDLVFYEEPRNLFTPLNLTSLNLQNISLTSLLNSSLIGYGALIIGGIILFEIALYLLDVYYNQTYLNGNGGSKSDDFGDQPLYYQDYPRYPDPFVTSFRSSRSTDINFTKIISWISMLEEAWGLAGSTFSSLECQKRVVCELWTNSYSRGHLHIINNIFKLAEFMDLPYELLDFFQEMSEVKEETNDLSDPEECGNVYYCPNSIDSLMKKYDSLQF